MSTSTPLFAGATTVDLAYAVDSYPAEDTKTLAREHFLGAGGPAANAAVADVFGCLHRIGPRQVARTRGSGADHILRQRYS